MLPLERAGDGRALRMIGTHSDIDEAKAREAQILDHRTERDSNIVGPSEDVGPVDQVRHVVAVVVAERRDPGLDLRLARIVIDAREVPAVRLT